ncbi:MAG: hypothetical protein FD174_2360 [Geobacteraceae bacterium]|nr:MAG: hypothetical protein FD174_2360 [Geobacteraceae bacterium]
MPIKSKFKALITLIMIICSVMSASMAYAAVATYTYDELDRLKRVDFDDGAYKQLPLRLLAGHTIHLFR